MAKRIKKALPATNALVCCTICGEMIDLAGSLVMDDGTWICGEHYVDHPTLAHGNSSV